MPFNTGCQGDHPPFLKKRPGPDRAGPAPGFSFLIGNSNMPLKNFSLIETSAGSGQYILSLAYDLLPVNIIKPHDPEQTTLAHNGKKSNLRRKDFLALAEHIVLPQQAAEGMLQHLLSLTPEFQHLCASSRLPGDMKEALYQLIARRKELLPGRSTAFVDI